MDGAARREAEFPFGCSPYWFVIASEAKQSQRRTHAHAKRDCFASAYALRASAD
jgi:hypothetical protein